MIRIIIILLILIINISLTYKTYIKEIIIIYTIYNIIRYINTNYIENKIGVCIKNKKEIDTRGYIIFLRTEIIIFLTF